ncbi:MAG: TlpA family protein disulfide reductase [Acidobacteria bacterium]|nr:TlpA family protein disulfide reductase [Acidobacteriota bacterium]
MKTILLLAFALATALFTTPYAGASFMRQPSPGPNLDQLKEMNITVKTPDGETVDLNTLLGEGKPVVLNFWATWCGPCRAEIPHLNALHKKYGKDGLVVIGLTSENPAEAQKTVRSFIRQFNMGYQVAFAPRAAYQFFRGRALASRIPQTFVFGADGKLIRHITGFDPRSGRNVLNRAVQRAMDEAQEKPAVLGM